MYKALIDTQSINDPSWLRTLEVVGEYDEEWPGEEIPVLHILKVRIADGALESIVGLLSEKIEAGWFAVVWNDELILVVLRGRIFKLTYPELLLSERWNELVSYGQANDIDQKYFLNMLTVMKKW